ncbi:MAG: aspartyl protease family protein [Bacteroidia bacterium]|nr:aspartyl protease family protein [Bacteroidia bacterium]
MKNFFFFFAICCSLLAGIPLAAQEEFIEPPSRMLTRIPFIQLTGGIVIMHAQLGDLPDTLNFILDTGSSGISLDSITADYLKLKPVPTERTIRGIGGIRKVPFLFNQKLHFPNLTVDSLDFHVNDYSILTAVYGERIDGIIGYSLINRYIIKINYDSLTIDLWSKGSIRYPRGGYLLKPIITTLPSHTIRVKDEIAITSRFLYDMGAGVCFMFSKDFMADSPFIKKRRKLWVKEGEGVGGKIDMLATVIREVKLGPYRFKSVPVHIFDDEYNVTSYPYLGGLIGNDILRRFNVILNYEKKDIYILPNSHFSDPFDYSYPGIELYMINGQIIIGDVAKGSPAELAGIREGDEVIAINKNFSQNLNAYKVLIQVPNSKARLIIRRDDGLQEIEFKIRSIR